METQSRYLINEPRLLSVLIDDIMEILLKNSVKALALIEPMLLATSFW